VRFCGPESVSSLKYNAVSNPLQTSESSNQFSKITRAITDIQARRKALSSLIAFRKNRSDMRSYQPRRSAFHAVTFVLVLFTNGCDHGLVPPGEPETGTISARITYLNHPESWPSRESILDLRFVAMRFMPQDTSDFLQLNRLVFSDSLHYRVAADTAVLSGVEVGPFFYSGVAWKHGPGLFDWRPVGLVESNGGVYLVQPNETTFVAVEVDFFNPPHFPPQN
jgi:hypothetical protein